MNQLNGTDGAIWVKEEGSNYYTLPGYEGEYIVPDGVTRIEVLAVGGGGGASLTKNGDAGLWQSYIFEVTPGTRFTYKIGRGGAGGSQPQDGGDTSFVLLRAP